MEDKVPKKKEKRISKKELGFCKDFVESGNGVKSAMKNYDVKNYETAGVIATQNLKKARIQKTIAEMLPDDLLKERHLQLLNKQEVRISTNKETGEIDVVQTGEIDPQAVSKGLDMAYKIKGLYAPEKHDITTKNLSNTEEVIAKAKKFDEWYKQNTK